MLSVQFAVNPFPSPTNKSPSSCMPCAFASATYPPWQYTVAPDSIVRLGCAPLPSRNNTSWLKTFEKKKQQKKTRRVNCFFMVKNFLIFQLNELTFFYE